MKKIIFLLTCLLAMFTYQHADAQGIRIYKGGKIVQTITVAEFDSIVSVEYLETEEEFVDLGLSVKWASRNLGAKYPEDYGDYFAWGETSPKSSYTFENSLTYGKSMGDISGNPQYDAAAANWGGGARMPTRAECEELIRHCTSVWTTRNGVHGRLVTGPNGNSIFLPAAGYRRGSSLYDAGDYGRYWGSAPHEDNDDGAYSLGFSGGYFGWYWSYRDYGLSVRPVRN